MTLHVGFSTPAFVLQVGDRLLTTTTNGVTSEWDAYANKSLLVELRGARIIIGFAGAAFIDDMPTDDWIAQTLLGRSLTKGMSDGYAMQFGGAFSLNLAEVISRLEAAIRRDYYRQSYDNRRNGLDILVTGWSWRRRVRFGIGRPRTLSFTISAGIKPSKYRFTKNSGRYWWRPTAPSSYTSIAAIGNSFNFEALVDHYEELRTRGEPKVLTYESIQPMLVQHIRDSAQDSRGRGKSIGTECMAIYLPIDAAPKLTFYRDARLTRTTATYTP